MDATRRTVILAAAALSAGGAARPVPRRVASLNPCLDVILVALADPAQIAALSHYSRQPDASSVGAAASRFPFTYEGADEIIALKPDLVLSSGHGSLATRQALHRVGIPMMLFAPPDTVEESLEQIRKIGDAIGRPGQARAEIARIRAALAAAVPPPHARPITALVFQRGGFSSGPGTLMDDLMRRTGFSNQMVRYGIARTSDVPLEQVIADPPQVLLAGEPSPGVPTWGERIMRHPALASIASRTRVVPFPERLMYCGGPNLVETAGRLAAARRLIDGAGA
jgi:iron complex transport system substrate-binding protein